MFLSTLGGMAVFIALFFLLSPLLGNHGLWIAYLAYLALRGVVLTVKSKTLYSF
jgi:MATE family multidrug resistance protein